MPLLMSSRITSAGLTSSSSASSLTVIVPGSSIAPRSRGSATWTAAVATPASRRCGLRGPLRPRVPLLLLAKQFSFDSLSLCRSAHGARSWSRLRSGSLRQSSHPRPRFAQARFPASPSVSGRLAPEGPLECSLGEGLLPAAAVSAEIGAPAGEPARGIHHDLARRRPHDPDELALLPAGPAGDAGPRRVTPGSRRRSRPAYEDTSPAAGLARLRFAVAGAGASSFGAEALAVLRDFGAASEAAADAVEAPLAARFFGAVDPSTAARRRRGVGFGGGRHSSPRPSRGLLPDAAGAAPVSAASPPGGRRLGRLAVAAFALGAAAVSAIGLAARACRLGAAGAPASGSGPLARFFGWRERPRPVPAGRR